jgi:phage-related protein
LVDLEVNSQMLHLDIDGHITLDSELMESYKDNALETFTGEFPILIEGLNSITWTGTVTEVEVIPRWRK